MADKAPKNAPAPAGRADRSVVPPVPDHEMIRRIGGGSYGEVWLARSVMGTYRAVKIVYRDTFDNERPFLREFNGIQKFEPISRSHESQVDILHVGKGEGYFYYVMELADDASAAEVSGQRPEVGGQSSAVGFNAATYTPRTLGRELYQRGKLPFEECLRISLALTTALEHLHQHGLVHRDIKPSNIIFVHGIPKLADIGLVTSIDATVSYVGTEGFLPPEGPGTPPGDLYSLGKVLYEICTGRDRQDFPELPTNLAELPEREGLLELNAVISKACQNDPGDRYQSATEMHADLVLLQSGKSVRRVRSLERRLARATRIGMAIAALGGVLALAFVFQRHETREARRLADENRRLAAKSQQVAQFLKDMLKGVAPSVALGRDTKLMREVLDKTAQRVGKDLTNQPEVEAEMRLTLAETYGELGLYQQEEEMARQALQLARTSLGPETPAVAEALGLLGDAVESAGNLEQGEAYYREALTLRRKLFGEENLLVAESLNFLANLCYERGKLAEADALGRQALAVRRKLLGNEHEQVAASLHQLSYVARTRGELTDAERFEREALVMRRKLLGEKHPDVAQSLNNLGLVLNDQGNLAEAEAVIREAVEMRRKLLGNAHPDLAGSLNNLGSVLAAEGKLAEAETMYGKALEMAETLLGNEHHHVAIALDNLAAVLRDEGKLGEAEPLYRKALAIQRKVYGNQSLVVASTLTDLIATLLAEKKFDEAEAPARECLATREAKMPDDWRTFSTRSLLGGSLLGQKKYVEAEPFLVSGYEGMKQREAKIPTLSRPRLKEALQRLVQLYEATGRPDQAAEWKSKLAQFDKPKTQEKVADSQP